MKVRRRELGISLPSPTSFLAPVLLTGKESVQSGEMGVRGPSEGLRSRAGLIRADSAGPAASFEMAQQRNLE